MRKREKPYAIEVKLNAACNKGSVQVLFVGGDTEEPGR